jgi:hypothetical protein
MPTLNLREKDMFPHHHHHHHHHGGGGGAWQEARMHDRAARADEAGAFVAAITGDIAGAMVLEQAAREERREAAVDRMIASDPFIAPDPFVVDPWAARAESGAMRAEARAHEREARRDERIAARAAMRGDFATAAAFDNAATNQRIAAAEDRAVARADGWGGGTSMYIPPVEVVTVTPAVPAPYYPVTSTPMYPSTPAYPGGAVPVASTPMYPLTPAYPGGAVPVAPPPAMARVAISVVNAKRCSDDVVRYVIVVRSTLPEIIEGAKGSGTIESVVNESGETVASVVFTIERRFNDIQELHKSLVFLAMRHRIVIPDLPPASLVEWLQRFDSSLWERRRRAFQNIFNLICSRPELSQSSEFARWVHPRWSS